MICGDSEVPNSWLQVTGSFCWEKCVIPRCFDTHCMNLMGPLTVLRPGKKNRLQTWVCCLIQTCGGWAVKKYTPRSLTARPWKMLVGRLLSHWRGPIDRGYVELWGGMPLVHQKSSKIQFFGTGEFTHPIVTSPQTNGSTKREAPSIDWLAFFQCLPWGEM